MVKKQPQHTIQRSDLLRVLVCVRSISNVCMLSSGVLQSLTRGVELGRSEWQETVVDKWLCQMVFQILDRALASHNSLQQDAPVETKQWG